MLAGPNFAYFHKLAKVEFNVKQKEKIYSKPKQVLLFYVQKPRLHEGRNCPFMINAEIKQDMKHVL